MEAIDIPRFRGALLRWYDEHRRPLPWREAKDPYAIWLSEIMLQQTRVAAVIGHYERFLQRFPTLVSLALAHEEDVLALWSGLGYYRRARLLHKAAQAILTEHGGSVPNDLATLRGIPGVGVYTSAAIASIAHGVAVAAVDGNVERVLARLMGQAEQRGAVKWSRLSQELLDTERPGDFNQAMMELGAMVCTPKSPACGACPLLAWCETRGEHPVKPRQKMRSVEVAYALVTRGSGRKGEVLLHKRPADAPLMAGMWELPQLRQAPKDDDEELVVRHSITNTNYYVRIFKTQPGSMAKRGKWVQQGKLSDMALTGLARKVLRRLGYLRAESKGRSRYRWKL